MNNNHHLFSLLTFQLHSYSSSDNTAGSVEPGTTSVLLEDFSNSDYNPLALRLSSKLSLAFIRA